MCGLRIRDAESAAFACLAMVALSSLLQAGEGIAGGIETGGFRIAYDDRSLTALAHPQDPFAAEVLAPGRQLEVTVRCKVGDSDWLEGQDGNDTYQEEIAVSSVHSVTPETPKKK